MNETTTQVRPAKVRLAGLWKDTINNTTILTGGLCGGIKLVLIPKKRTDPDSRKPDALMYSVTKDMLEGARATGIDEDTFKGHRITGLWVKEGRNGKFYAGDWEPDTSLFVFRNNNQQPGKNQPDYELFLVPKVRKPMEADHSDDQHICEETPEELNKDNWLDYGSVERDYPSDDDFAGITFD